MSITPQLRADRADEVLGNPRRLAAVRGSGLLDSPAEETFDSLSRLAAKLIDVPVSFLSILDEKRDIYKSQCGFPEPLAAARQLEGRTFCHYALASPEPLVIQDTHAHPVWREVPTVASLGVRAYLGVPVVIEGQVIGSFCVIDSQPRSWTPLEIETLVQFSRTATREIELKASLDKSRAETERANTLAKANEELLAIVIHDLRAPIQAIGLSAASIARLVDSSVQPHVERLIRATDSMRHLVNELLTDYTAKSAQRASRSVISTTQLLTDSIDTVEMIVERAGINLSIHSDVAGRVSVDYSQMLRVLGNLVGNCVKYCPAGSSVLLRADAIGDDIVISVSDDGPGMTVEDQAQAFERGWQGSDGVARQDGAGLGLSIVRELVAQNGGRVVLSSQLGRGTSVAIRLPSVAV